MFSVIKRLFREEFNNLLFLNLLVAALCLPVITIGPALLALTGTLVKIVDDRCQLNRIQEFWSLFKKKFWNGVLFELIFAAYAFMLLWCASLAGQLQQGAEIVAMLTLIMAVLAALVSVCVCVILASVQISFGQALWNGILMAVGRFPRVLLSALCVYGMLYIGFLLYPISVVPLVIVMISATAVLSLGCIWPALDELVLSQSSEEDSLPQKTNF